MADTDKKICYYSLFIVYPNWEKIILTGNVKNKELYEVGITDMLRKRNIISIPTLVVTKGVFSNANVFYKTFKQ